VEEYRRQLKQAPFYLDYLIEKAREKIRPESGRSKAEALNWLLPYLSRVSKPTERMEMADQVANKLGVDDLTLRRELDRAARDRRSEIRKNVVTRAERLTLQEIQLLHSVLRDENLASELLSFCQPASYYGGLASERIVKTVLDILGDQESLDAEKVASRLSQASDRELFMRILYEEVEPFTYEHFLMYLEGLKRDFLGKEKIVIQKQIKDAGSRGDEIELKKLLRTKQELDIQFAELSRELKDTH
jgi:DNA primase